MCLERLYIADTFSTASLKETTDASSSSSLQEIEHLVQAIMATFPASPDCLNSYRKRWYLF